jgi:hypothetical protein
MAERVREFLHRFLPLNCAELSGRYCSKHGGDLRNTIPAVNGEDGFGQSGVAKRLALMVQIVEQLLNGQSVVGV